MKVHKNYHYAMMLIFQKKCGRLGEGESENSDTCGRPLWMAPNVLCIKNPTNVDRPEI